jgi:hypothetical protein
MDLTASRRQLAVLAHVCLFCFLWEISTPLPLKCDGRHLGKEACARAYSSTSTADGGQGLRQGLTVREERGARRGGGGEDYDVLQPPASRGQ